MKVRKLHVLPLAAIVGAGLLARASAIWLGRPEFVGWFNHSYYYWVQVRGLLERGRLPYADLPLLFHLDAGVASLARWLGLGTGPAIVNGTRLVMCVAPALIAVPACGIARRINGQRPLAARQWVLISLTAFLPLTFVHMPELLQKNVLGLLFLACFLYAVLRLLHERTTRWAATVLVVFVAIALTHLGTLVAASLGGAALLGALALETRLDRRTLYSAAGFGCAVLVGVGAVSVLDADAFARIVRYARTSMPESLFGGLVSAPPKERTAYLLAILIPASAAYVSYRCFRLRREALPPADRVFWLGNIVFAYLLVLPVTSVEVLPRLVLFLPLPAFVVLAYHLRWVDRPRLNAVAVGVAALGTAAMLAGEVTSLVRLYPDKAEMHAELMRLRADERLTADDFVITRYAVNPACNWFLGTRSGLITAFNRSDLETYDRVYVLNPRGGGLPPGARDRAEDGTRLVVSDADRYRQMRRDVPLPAGSEPLDGYEHIDVFELTELPESWLFGDDGQWIGYTDLD